MSVVMLLTLFLIGLVVGFVSGLVGIGGGVLVVPFLYFFYGHPEWSGVVLRAELHTLVAHATSLFIVIPTAIWGARAYTKAGLVIWRVAVPVAGAASIAAIAGVQLALVLPGSIVRVAFGAFLLVAGAQLIWRPHALEGQTIRLHPASAALIGGVVGVLSGLMGIGGGAIAAALLIYLARLSLKQAAATSLAVMGMAAVVGAARYVKAGWGVAELPPGSLGYIHMAAALPILVGSVLTVKYGSLTNQRLDNRTLKRIFAAFFTLLGIYLIVDNISAVISGAY